MFDIFNSVRATLIAAVVVSPVAALAQTPRDVANLVWQQNVPAYVSAAPTASIGFSGAGSAADVAHLAQTNNVSGTVSNAPSSDTVFATSFGAQDVARLSGKSDQSLFVIRNNGITVAEGAR